MRFGRLSVSLVELAGAGPGNERECRVEDPVSSLVAVETVREELAQKSAALRPSDREAVVETVVTGQHVARDVSDHGQPGADEWTAVRAVSDLVNQVGSEASGQPERFSVRNGRAIAIGVCKTPYRARKRDERPTAVRCDLQHRIWLLQISCWIAGGGAGEVGGRSEGQRRRGREKGLQLDSDGAFERQAPCVDDLGDRTTESSLRSWDVPLPTRPDEGPTRAEDPPVTRVQTRLGPESGRLIVPEGYASGRPSVGDDAEQAPVTAATRPRSEQQHVRLGLDSSRHRPACMLEIDDGPVHRLGRVKGDGDPRLDQLVRSGFAEMESVGER